MKRSEVFALVWIVAFPVLIFCDGWIVTSLGLFGPGALAWDTALKYYYMALAGVDAVLIVLYGFVFRKKESQ